MVSGTVLTTVVKLADSPLWQWWGLPCTVIGPVIFCDTYIKNNIY